MNAKQASDDYNQSLLQYSLVHKSVHTKYAFPWLPFSLEDEFIALYVLTHKLKRPSFSTFQQEYVKLCAKHVLGLTLIFALSSMPYHISNSAQCLTGKRFKLGEYHIDDTQQ